jgi:hypothetical protein
MVPFHTKTTKVTSDFPKSCATSAELSFFVDNQLTGAKLLGEQVRTPPKLNFACSLDVLLVFPMKMIEITPEVPIKGLDEESSANDGMLHVLHKVFPVLLPHIIST